MTISLIATLLFSFLLVAAAVGYSGYYVTHQGVEPFNVAVLSASPALEPITEQLPTPAVAGATTEISQMQVESESAPSPTSSPRPTPTPTPTPMPQATSTPASTTSIDFLDTPSTVTSGQSFTIRWRIGGPAGQHGENTTLKTVLASTTTKNNGHSSTNSNVSNSFGSFTTPATFDSKFTFAGEPATLQATVTAVLNGQTLTATKTIEINR